MRDLLRAFVLMVLAAIALAIVAPGVLFGVRLADTWTAQATNQLLGGGLAICGGGAAIVAVLIGAGLFARLAGWRPPRREDRMPPDIEAPYPQSTPAQAPPPWGVTGGDDFRLLPPPAEGGDRRYHLDTQRMQPSGNERRYLRGP